ncbi:MAG: tRNA isopentenyltransferase MiaA [Parcubacteria group bacterium Gr01-1014_38]|nr:MAG: tRNA isopentenyltransferase MiaA [Parcubacteria group bacterium Gr01-1014_38]
MRRQNSAVVIMGPTGAGKSALALELAQALNGEIITADSRQIYAGMDIGTEKPGRRTLGVGKSDEPILVAGIPHYLLDILTPDQQYSAAAFRDDAEQLIADIRRRRKLPIVVGGTGFYVRVLTSHRSLPDVPPDSAFRAWAETQSVETLARELKALAPDLYARVDQVRNKRRVIRALEIARAGSSGVHEAPSGQSAPPVRFLKLALVPPPEVLRERLTSRVEEEFRHGFVEEVRRLVQQYGESAPGLQAVGYRQVLPYLRGETTLAETTRAVLRAHREYARRQQTWLKGEPELVRVASAAEARRVITDVLQRKNSGQNDVRPESPP